MASGGKGSSGKKTLYFGTIAGALGEGPAWSLEWIIVGGKIVWSGGMMRPENADNGTDLDLIDVGHAVFYWGTSTQNPSPVLNKFADHPAYRGWVYIVFDDCCFGRNGETAAPTVEIGWRRLPNQLVVSGNAAGSDGAATSNGIACASEYLTSWNWANIPANAINAESFQAVADQLQAEAVPNTNRHRAAVSPIVNEPTSIKSLLANLSTITNSWLRIGSDGRIEAGRWSRSGSVNCTAIKFSDCIEWDVEPDEPDELPNLIVVEYRDAGKHHKTNCTKIPNTAAIRNANGRVRPTTAKRSELIWKDQADSHGMDLLRSASIPDTTCKVTVRRAKAVNPDGSQIRPGDYFTFPISEPGETEDRRLFRCVRRSFGPTGPIELHGELEKSGTVFPAVAVTPETEIEAVTPPAAYSRVLAIPPLTSDDKPCVGAFVARPADMAYGFSLYYCAEYSGDYGLLGTQTAFALPLTLAQAKWTDETTFRLSLVNGANGINAKRDRTLLTNWNGGDVEARNDDLLILLIRKDGNGNVMTLADGVTPHMEFVSVAGPASAVATDTYDVPVLRGRMGTSAKEWNSGSFPDAWANYEAWLIPSNVMDSFSHDDFYTPNQQAYFRIATFAQSGDYAPDAAWTERQRRAAEGEALEEFSTQLNGVWCPLVSYTFPAKTLSPAYSTVDTRLSDLEKAGITVMVFKRSATAPEKPTGGTYANPVPAGWSAGNVTGTAPLWMSRRKFTSSGEGQDAAWTDPVMMDAAATAAKLVVLVSDSQFFKISKAGANTPSFITITAGGQNVTGDPVFSIVSGEATLTDTAQATSKTLAFESMASDLVTVQVSWNGVVDRMTIAKVREGADAVQMILSNEAHTLPASNNGTVIDWTGAATTVKVMRGAVDDSDNWSISTADTNCTSFVSGKTVSLLGALADAGYVDITATRSGYASVTRRFSFSKSRQGAEGVTAIAYPTDLDGSPSEWTTVTDKVRAANAGAWNDTGNVYLIFQFFRGSTSIGYRACPCYFHADSGTWTATAGDEVPASGVPVVFSGNDTASVTVTATHTASGAKASFSLTAVQGGAAGVNAKLVALSTNSQVFQVAKSGTISPASITLAATGQNLSGSPVFAVTAGTATLTGTGNTRTLAYGNLQTDSATITVTWDGLTDSVTIAKVREGSDSVAAVLSNDAHTVPADAAGNVSSFAGAVSTMKVFVGSVDDSASWTFSKADSNCTSSLSGSTATVTALAGDVGTVTITATKGGVTVSKVFTVTKSKQGTAGSPGSNGDSVFVQFSADGSSWHDAYATGDIYARQKTGVAGVWSAGYRIIGEQGQAGASGSFIDVRFARGAYQPSTPTGWAPQGWSDTPPAGTDPLWMTKANKSYGPNQIKNPGAELGALNWYADAAGVDAQDFASGLFSFFTYTWSTSEKMTVKPGVAYRVRWKMKRTAAASAVYAMIASNSSESGNYVSSGSTTYLYTGAVTNGWVLYETEWTAPAGHTVASFRIQNAYDGSNILKWDDVEFLECIPGTWSTPQNLKGETGNTGVTGNKVERRYKVSALQPATPSDRNPSGWTVALPVPMSGNARWMIEATVNASDALVGSWTSPVRMDGEMTFYASPGTITSGLYALAEGDRLYDPANGFANYRYESGAWVSKPLGDGAFGNISAGKITAGEIDAAISIGTLGSLSAGTGYNAFNVSHNGTVFGDANRSIKIASDSYGTGLKMFYGTTMKLAMGFSVWGSAFLNISNEPDAYGLYGSVNAPLINADRYINSPLIRLSSTSDPRSTSAPLYNAGGTWLAGTLDARGASYFNGAATFSGTATFGSGATFNSYLWSNYYSVFSGTMERAGSGEANALNFTASGGYSKMWEDYGLQIKGGPNHPINIVGGSLALGATRYGNDYQSGRIYFGDSVYLYLNNGVLYVHDGNGDRAI